MLITGNFVDLSHDFHDFTIERGGGGGGGGGEGLSK